MRNIFKLSQQQNDLFRSTIPVTVYGGGENQLIEALNRTIDVQYSIDIEYRSFGIKDLNFSPVGIIELAVQNEESMQQFTLQIDCSQLQKETTPGNGVWADSLDIWLTPQMQVDYGHSSITFACFNG
jgi:hypothetical protein